MIGQYYIQYLGERAGVNQESLGAGSSASQSQYGAAEEISAEKYYRIIARSSDRLGMMSARSLSCKRLSSLINWISSRHRNEKNSV